MADMIEKSSGIQDSHFRFNKYAIDCENHNNGFAYRPVFTTIDYAVPLGGSVSGQNQMLVEEQNWSTGEITSRPAKKNDNPSSRYQYCICPKCGKQLWIRFQLEDLKDDAQ